MPTPEQLTPDQLAHNDQVFAAINDKLDFLKETRREVAESSKLHPQVQLGGFARVLEKNSNAEALSQMLAVAIDRLLSSEEVGRG